MVDLVVRFECANAEARAEEFQHHLVDTKIRVKPETKEGEVWLTYSGIPDDAFKKIVKEAHPWCLDRGLSLMQNLSGEGSSGKPALLIEDVRQGWG